MRQDQADWWLDEQGAYRRWVLDHVNFSKQYFSAIISSSFARNWNTNCALLSEIYRTLRRIWEGRDIVLLRGDNNQTYIFDIYDNARTQTIILAPRYHAYSVYQKLKDKLLAHGSDKLFILTAGPVSRLLAYDLAMSGRRALDLGHLAKDYDYYMRGVNPDNFHFYERDETPPAYLEPYPDGDSF